MIHHNSLQSFRISELLAFAAIETNSISCTSVHCRTGKARCARLFLKSAPWFQAEPRTSRQCREDLVHSDIFLPRIIQNKCMSDSKVFWTKDKSVPAIGFKIVLFQLAVLKDFFLRDFIRQCAEMNRQSGRLVSEGESKIFCHMLLHRCSDLAFKSPGQPIGRLARKLQYPKAQLG